MKEGWNGDFKVFAHLLPALQHDAGLLAILKVLDDPLSQMDRDAQFVPRVLKNYRMQLAAVAIENGGLLDAGRGVLGDDVLAGVLVDAEAVVGEVDAQRAHAVRNFSLRLAPTIENAAGIGAEGDDVAQRLEFGKGLVDLHAVALAVAFDGRRQPAEA